MKPFLVHDPLGLSPFFESGRRTTYEVGDRLSGPAPGNSDVHLITSGVYRVSISTSDGGERMLFYGYAGSVIGDTLCFGGAQNLPAGLSASAVSVVTTMTISQARFRAACERNPEILGALLTLAYSKVARLIEQVEIATFRNTTAQVAALVHAFWAEEARGGVPLPDRGLLAITHQDVAAATGRTRVAVTHALNRLRSAGVVALHRGRIEVLDAASLATIGEGGVVDAPAAPEWTGSRESRSS